MLTAPQRAFLEAFEVERPDLESLAAVAEDFVRETLGQKNFALHVVTGRAKSTASVRLKLMRKGYVDPAIEMTDLIGVRVITYYGSFVDSIIDSLREQLVIDEDNSL